jgi:hypothetical protein
MIKTVELSRIKTAAQFKNLLEKVEKSSDQFLFKRKGKAVAALVSPADLEAIPDAMNVMAEHRKALFKIMDRVHAKNPGLIEEEVDEVIMATRDKIRRADG